MSLYKVSLYTDADLLLWEEFCNKSTNTTFQNTRKFLDYHKDRFIERSLLIYQDSQLIAIFPAASSVSKPEIVSSHIGASYGGILISDSVYGDDVLEVYKEITCFYADLEIESLVVKVTPSIFQNAIVQDESYTLWKLGADLIRSDLSACIALDHRLKISSLRKRSCKKAVKKGVTLDRSFDNIKEFYGILLENLSQKHAAKPVHTLEELVELNERLKGELTLTSALDQKGNVIAGVLFFTVNKVVHAQYIASSTVGYELSALDLLFESEINLASDTGKNYFNFGISNENNGLKLNQSLYRFKRQFGAGSVACQFFEIKVKND